ncbi:DUF1127 domain-containing protein [Palleronia pelagia]|uniref:DUF1127 domain-containing protein n=1 Tax=Palleronia pelagia TaxID=387096 RepID=A0A1H8JP38_9RHOB|nr:DUF1127 domain-containing protein [Palleronia pelagia]SEN82325.1 protein of unknown function [Palleronia pelagia]
MADISFHPTHVAQDALSSIKNLFAQIGHGLVAMGENSSRYRRLTALNRLSDAQLAERGLKREDIVRHVFADVFYV